MKNKELLFIISLYELANNSTKEYFGKLAIQKKELLTYIGEIMLTYTITDLLMDMTKEQKDKEYNKISKIITKNGNANIKAQTKKIEEILKEVTKESYKHYGYNFNNKDVLEIVKKDYKDKHFSTRVWENEKEVASRLHKQLEDFINGKINVNDIKNVIGNTYNNSVYEVKRLVETEVSRCQSNAFNEYAKFTGVKKVKYNATLEACEKCRPNNGEIFDFDKAPSLPKHPFCKCFYEVEE